MIDLGDIDGDVFNKMKSQIDSLANVIYKAQKEAEKDPELQKIHGEGMEKAKEILREAKIKSGNIDKDIEELKNYK
jgi:regulator of protease activity HflC (stomatin/prohibitin superfamily)